MKRRVRVQLFLDEDTWFRIVEVCRGDSVDTETALRWSIKYGLDHIDGIKKRNGQAILEIKKE